MKLFLLALVGVVVGFASMLVPLLLPFVLGCLFFNFQDYGSWRWFKRITIGFAIAIGIAAAALMLSGGNIMHALSNIGSFMIGCFGTWGWKKVLDPNRMYIP